MPRFISVELPKTAYYTGDVVEGTVVLETTKETPSRGLYVDFSGKEATAITRSSGKSSVTYRSEATLVSWRLPLQGEGTVPPGTYRYPFRFQIPLQGLPSYRGPHAKVEYGLTARLDVPLWLDTVWSSEVFVFYDRPSVRTYSNPVRFRSGGDGPEVYVELDGDRFFAREILGCRITLLRTGDHRIRRLYAQLLGSEFAQAQSQHEQVTTFRTEVDVAADQIKLGIPFTFEIPIPADVQSAYRGTYSYYSYVLRVGLDIAWGADLVAQTPIVIVR